MIEKNSNNKNIKSLEEYYKSQNKVEINQNNIIKENTNNLLDFVKLISYYFFLNDFIFYFIYFRICFIWILNLK